ncbi:hypothetical protein GGX14DRAFT_601605 [Mycena pura]|uniref:F-box domain-containing protein n=1 Tax=Mycena pura TaxID=153505 RepID=A0AAD6VMV1_9AGAR|nr:hypothetical protein GGX14DRAFT_601605 [Mycena pura]
MSIVDFPTELLELIFIYSHNASNAHPIRSTDAPLNLSQTCTRWKEVASGIPFLWSTISAVANHTSSTPPVKVVVEWMHLSDAHPLTLSLACQRQPAIADRDGSPSSPDCGVSRILELFLVNMYRWRAVSFDFTQQAPPIHYPDSLTASGAPQLECLEIYPFSWSPRLGTLSIPWIVPALSAPLLRSFTSHQGKFPSAFFFQIQWGQLTHLHLETHLSELACLFILQSAFNLVECHLLNVRREFVEAVPNFDPLLVATLPCLRVLGLASQVGFERLFRLLVTPELRALELATRSTQMRWDHAQFMAFLRRSSCPITSLTLRDLFISRLATSELRELLTQISDTLTSLAITSDIPGTPVMIQSAFLRELVYRPTGSVLCPQLERLSLQIGTSAQDGELGRMVVSRLAGHRQAPARIARLQHIDVVCATDTHVEDVRQLHALLEDDLEGRVRVLADLQNADDEADLVAQRNFRRRSFT